MHRIGIKEINSFNRNSRLPTSMYLEWSLGEILLKSTSPTPINRLSWQRDGERYLKANRLNLVQFLIVFFRYSFQVTNIFNLFITYGDSFLSTPSSYDELYYEVMRMHQVSVEVTAKPIVTRCSLSVNDGAEKNGRVVVHLKNFFFYGYVRRGMFVNTRIARAHEGIQTWVVKVLWEK